MVLLVIRFNTHDGLLDGVFLLTFLFVTHVDKIGSSSLEQNIPYESVDNIDNIFEVLLVHELLEHLVVSVEPKVLSLELYELVQMVLKLTRLQLP